MPADDKFFDLPQIPTRKCVTNPTIDQGDGTTLVFLTRGKVAIVDTEDWAILRQWCWCATANKKNWYVAARVHKLSDGTSTVARMHQFLCGRGADHRNGNGLDNRRKNLRRATNAQNVFNQKRRLFGRGTTPTPGGRWLAQMTLNYKVIYLGTYSTLREAYEARLIGEAIYRPEFLREAA